MKKVLIIEDDADTIDVISIILEYFNYTVIKSEKKIPVEEIVEINPNIILLDYLLDDGYGSELCFKLKVNHSTKHLPIILISAKSHLEKVIEDCHADAFIAKPFDLCDLVELVDKLAI